MRHERTILGPQFAPAWHRPWFRYIAPVDGAEGGAVEATESVESPAADAAQDQPQEKTDTTDWKAEARKWEKRAKANDAKAKAHDEAEAAKLSEIEREKKRAEEAEAKATSRETELLQLRAALKYGISDDDRQFITASTEEEIESQAARLAERFSKPSTATARDAGITGGGKEKIKTRSKSLTDAVAARVNQN